MSFVSIREVTPHAGKESVVRERMQEISAVMENMVLNLDFTQW